MSVNDLPVRWLRLLAGAVLVVDGDGVIRYIEIVRELGSGPDYEAAPAAVRGRQVGLRRGRTNGRELL